MDFEHTLNIALGIREPISEARKEIDVRGLSDPIHAIRKMSARRKGVDPSEIDAHDIDREMLKRYQSAMKHQSGPERQTERAYDLGSLLELPDDQLALEISNIIDSADVASQNEILKQVENLSRVIAGIYPDKSAILSQVASKYRA